ncbi:hypothetical protein [Phenylobacterium sp. SCN 70-31]|uniref:hypothetical protein n=1 Tax=Phenylobacterium sp. SCN 70-31 TaxID=1660129 RepID=UPI00086E9852|nr:hypothetical protein [Phenylobacterium sp. SCN 70-31]ODT84843.1 MAG: hypothetical protein ABS78_22055 [Phenylobacterium sp. SCN 70-31]
MTGAILIPCHPPKLRHLSNFLRSANGTIPIIVAATNDHERSQLLPATREFTGVDVISCEAIAKETGQPFDPHSKGIINAKKFLGLFHAMDQGFEHVMCVDSETEIVTTTNEAMEAAEKAYGRLLGVSTPNHAYNSLMAASGLLTGSQTAFPYFWFYDPPTYRRDHLQAFKAAFPAFLSNLTWETFDHLVYGLYGLSQGWFEITDHKPITDRIPEALTASDLTHIEAEFGHAPIWMTKKEWEAADPKPAVHMTYHADRRSWK